ncbi:MAG: hypothetical protein ACO1SV_21220 [Fimbriimonas sp.]
MLLDDALIDRVYRLKLATLRATAEGYTRVRSDSVGKAVGTGYALFAGEGSPLTQVMGFGHREANDPAELDAFYEGLAENWEVTVTPFTAPETLRALTAQGYRPSHFEGTLVQTVGEIPRAPEVEIVELDEATDAWSETTWRSWAEDETSPFAPDDLVRAVGVMPARRYLALVDGIPAATASLMPFEEGVVLGGAATRLPFRGRGLQTALLARRLRDAGPGTLAVIGAMPGTVSHRNAQRAGFQPLYSVMVWMRR